MNGSLQAPQQQLLQPQTTGSNPFRQSMLVPQSTGMQLFGANMGQMGGLASPNQGGFNMGSPVGPSSMPHTPVPSAPFAAPTPSPFLVSSANPSNMPARPASTPLTSSMSAQTSNLQPVKSHQTGTRNPFGPVSTDTPPVPKAPTLFELSTGMFNQNQANQNAMNQFGMQQQQQQQMAQQQQPQQTGMNGFNFANSALNPGASDISSVASSFTFSNKPQATGAPTSPLTSQNTSATNSTTTSGSAFSDSLFSSGLSSQQTGSTNASAMSPTMQNSSMQPVKSHVTGFSGLKPFKPSSSFGASLVGTLPSIPGSAPQTPAITGLPAPNGLSSPSAAGTGSSPSFLSSPPGSGPANGSTAGGGLSFLNNQPTGATGGFGSTPGAGGGPGLSKFGQSLGVGLRPQMTGGGSANPFRASSAGMPTGGLPMPNFGGGFQSSMPTGMGMGMGSSQPFGANFGASPFGMQNQNQQQQQANGTASLI